MTAPYGAGKGKPEHRSAMIARRHEISVWRREWLEDLHIKEDAA